MTIRTRLTLWYAGILMVSLLVIGFGTYEEILGAAASRTSPRTDGTRPGRNRRNGF